ncbi:MAG TPA: hydroxysqualene dehydroxylase HpnE [Rhizomicrobium sp.]
MSVKRAFVIGAGLSGLSAATALAARGVKVELIEGAASAGGRCRSYVDPVLDCLIDNGNHLVLSGNRAVMGYVERIGSRAALTGPTQAHFDFVDLKSGERWSIAPNDGPLPWWVAAKSRRVPGTDAGDYARYARLLWAGRRKTIGQVLACEGALWEKLMRPFLLAALNTEPEISSAALAGQVIRETLAKGGQACRPRIATPSLAAAFVDPALAFITAHGGAARLGQRVRNIVFAHKNASALELPQTTLPLSPHDAIILAVPPWAAKELVPDLTAPDEFRAIVNAHFKIATPKDAPPILGVVGGTAEWIFSFPDRISVTVSSADAIMDQDREALARTIWGDVARALNMDASLPAWQIVKERRATFAATPAQDALRPKAKTRWRNFFLAGDWTDTGLPATIEGSLRSGEKAASLALRHLAL